MELREHPVELYGHQAPRPPRQQLKKLWNMARSRANLSDALKIKRKISQEQIKLVWRHSISRVIGPRALYLSRSRAQHIITHHELGLFHPYPSRISSVDQLPKARSLWSRIQAGQTHHPLKLLALVGKYWLVWLMHQTFRRSIDTHIVPSLWMKDMVQAWHPEAKIIHIPHFFAIES